MSKIVGKHGWQHEVTPWSRHWDFAEWLEAVCQGRLLDDSLAQACHAAQWEPADCREYMQINQAFSNPPKPREEPKSRVVILDVEAINKRFALCLWRECGKLLSRRTTPEARQLVCSMYDRMAAQAGIEIVGRVEED